MHINILIALLAVTVSATAVLLPPKEMREQGQLYKQVTKQTQPIKAEQLPQPLSKAETVVEKKTVPFGSHEQWMAAAGMQPGDYASAEFIISNESGWRIDAVNPSSGSCGLVQALPCSKISGDWKNPVDALRWGDSYVKSRYGSWAGAVAWWQVHQWY